MKVLSKGVHALTCKLCLSIVPAAPPRLLRGPGPGAGSFYELDFGVIFARLLFVNPWYMHMYICVAMNMYSTCMCSMAFWAFH